MSIVTLYSFLNPTYERSLGLGAKDDKVIIGNVILLDKDLISPIATDDTATTNQAQTVVINRICASCVSPLNNAQFPMPNSQFVVSPAWLFEHLEDPQVVIVDCRFSLADPQLGQQQYQTSHLEGSYYLDLNQDLSSPVGKHGGRHPLPNPNDIANKFAAIGVNYQKTLVVAYDDSRFAFAARLWWLLRYLGHEQVAVLDGGFAGWQKAGYPVTDVVPQPGMGMFVAQVQTEKVVDITAVKSRKESHEVVLVDSRESDRYRGEREPTDKIAGHIPGAVNYPWQEVTDSSGYLLPQGEQRRRWKQLETAEEILVYCGSGVTACVNLLSLELAGINKGKLYAGSWSDWISYL